MPIGLLLKAYETTANKWGRYASVLGVESVLAFMLFGLTENWLAHKQLVMTFSLVLAITTSRFSAKTE